MYRRRISSAVALVGVAALVMPVGMVRGAATEDEQWPNPFEGVAGLHTFLIEESPQTAGSASSVSVLFSNPLSTGTFLCSSLMDPKCTQPEGYHFRAVLQPCDAKVTIDCIESVSSVAGGVESKGTFSKMFPAKGVNSFNGSVSAKVPNGTTPSIWTLKDAPHAFGSDYIVMVSVSGEYKEKNFDPVRSFTAQIIPVSEFQTGCTIAGNGTCQETYSQGYDADGRGKLDSAGVAEDYGKYRCAIYGENAKCALRHAFPAGISYSLKVRLSSEPSGWLHGRINNATASILTESGVTTLAVTAQPVRVPSIADTSMWADLPVKLRTWFDTQCSSGNCGTRLSDTRGLAGPFRNAIAAPGLFDPKSFADLALWKDQLKDKAAATPSMWSVRTMGGNETAAAGNCITKAKGVTGIVSTNATIYSQGPPSYDSATGTLQYKVATTHYQTDGVTPFKGSYEMIMRSDIARCIYGFTSAPIQATVEVIEENGTTGTATTSVSEAGGWLKLTAAGFTFSAPTVRAKLSQAEVTTTTSTAPATATTAPVASTTSSTPTMKVKGTMTTSSVAKKGGLAVPRGARVTVSVSATSRKVCQVSAGKLKALKKGTCKVSVSVVAGKKKTSKSVSLTVL